MPKSAHVYVGVVVVVVIVVDSLVGHWPVDRSSLCLLWSLYTLVPLVTSTSSGNEFHQFTTVSKTVRTQCSSDSLLYNIYTL